MPGDDTTAIIPTMEEMDAAGVYGALPFNRNILPESARHFSLGYLRYLYRIGDVRGLRITGNDSGVEVDLHPPRSPEEVVQWKWQDWPEPDR